MHLMYYMISRGALIWFYFGNCVNCLPHTVLNRV